MLKIPKMYQDNSWRTKEITEFTVGDSMCRIGAKAPYIGVSERWVPSSGSNT